MAANARAAFCTEKFTKCPAQFAAIFFFCPRTTLQKKLGICSETQGIYVIICLSLRSNRQSLSRQQGIILIKTANAVIIYLSVFENIVFSPLIN